MFATWHGQRRVASIKVIIKIVKFHCWGALHSPRQERRRDWLRCLVIIIGRTRYTYAVQTNGIIVIVICLKPFRKTWHLSPAVLLISNCCLACFRFLFGEPSANVRVFQQVNNSFRNLADIIRVDKQTVCFMFEASSGRMCGDDLIRPYREYGF